MREQIHRCTDYGLKIYASFFFREQRFLIPHIAIIEGEVLYYGEEKYYGVTIGSFLIMQRMISDKD